uniref:Uncharacterized protein n=1 Tax=Panagrolaimus sp. ES5 TaxID=591445 RepID=A0AC34FRL1_9BILA
MYQGNLDADDVENIKWNNTFKIEHHECLNNKVRHCLRGHKCLLKLEFDAIDETLNECRIQAFQKLRISLDSDDMEKISTKDTVENIDDLATKMIGPLSDKYSTKLSQNIVDTFGNLTYEQLNAIKEVAVIQPYTQNYFCYFPKTITLQKLKKAKIFHEFPKISVFPDYYLSGLSMITKTEFRKLTEAQFNAVKEVVKIHPHFRCEKFWRNRKMRGNE